MDDRSPVLVVDDDPDIRDTLREVIEAEGFAVVCAANGRAALEALGRRDAAAADAFRDRLGRPAPGVAPVDYASGGERFVRPVSLQGLFAALKEHPNARLVAGATEIGVDVTKKAASFPLLVSTDGIPELSGVECTDASWSIGASTTLTTVAEALGTEFPSFAKMVRVFAARQIRNRDGDTWIVPGEVEAADIARLRSVVGLRGASR